MQLIKEKSAHWYRVQDGICSSCHEWPKKDGSGMKRTTLREAKAHNLLPSVTNVIDGVIAKPELINWRITQGIMAALTLPQKAGESMDDFAVRVAEDMDAYSAEARDFGTECHDHIDHFITHGEILQNDAEPFTKGARDWIRDNVTAVHDTEMTVHHPVLRVGGRLDLDCTVRNYGRSIVDFKSQKVRKKPNGEWNPNFYDEFPLQLAAYADCIRFKCSGTKAMQEEESTMPLPTLISVIIGSEEPGPAFAQAYVEGEYFLRLFKHTLDLWCYKKGYDPREVIK